MLLFFFFLFHMFFLLNQINISVRHENITVDELIFNIHLHKLLLLTDICRFALSILFSLMYTKAGGRTLTLCPQSTLDQAIINNSFYIFPLPFRCTLSCQKHGRSQFFSWRFALFSHTISLFFRFSVLFFR